MKDRQQIVIIDEHTATRAEMVKFISGNPDYDIKDFENITNFIDYLRIETQVDLVLLELMYNGHLILDHFYKIPRLVPMAKVLVTTENASEATLIRSIQEGAAGYYVKSGNWSPLPLAVERVLADDAYISPEVTRYLIRHVALSAKILSNNIYELNRRETEILAGLMEGLQYKEIASRYFISIDTVRHYVLSLYRKIGVNSRKALLERLKK